MNDETIKLARLDVDRLKAVFLVHSGLVDNNVLARFENFKTSI